MEPQSTDKEATNDVMRGRVEKLLYALATLFFCAVPFLIPGFSATQGVLIFLGVFIALLGLIIFFIIRRGRNTR